MLPFFFPSSSLSRAVLSSLRCRYRSPFKFLFVYFIGPLLLFRQQRTLAFRIPFQFMHPPSAACFGSRGLAIFSSRPFFVSSLSFFSCRLPFPFMHPSSAACFGSRGLSAIFLVALSSVLLPLFSPFKLLLLPIVRHLLLALAA